MRREWYWSRRRRGWRRAVRRSDAAHRELPRCAQMYADADEEGKASLSKAWEEGRSKREGRKEAAK